MSVCSGGRSDRTGESVRLWPAQLHAVDVAVGDRPPAPLPDAALLRRHLQPHHSQDLSQPMMGDIWQRRIMQWCCLWKSLCPLFSPPPTHMFTRMRGHTRPRTDMHTQTHLNIVFSFGWVMFSFHSWVDAQCLSFPCWTWPKHQALCKEKRTIPSGLSECVWPWLGLKRAFNNLSLFARFDLSLWQVSWTRLLMLSRKISSTLKTRSLVSCQDQILNMTRPPQPTPLWNHCTLETCNTSQHVHFKCISLQQGLLAHVKE